MYSRPNTGRPTTGASYAPNSRSRPATSRPYTGSNRPWTGQSTSGRPQTGTGRPWTGQTRPGTGRPGTAASNYVRHEASYIVAVLEGRGVAREVGMAALEKDTGQVVLVQVSICGRPGYMRHLGGYMRAENQFVDLRLSDIREDAAPDAPASAGAGPCPGHVRRFGGWTNYVGRQEGELKFCAGRSH